MQTGNLNPATEKLFTHILELKAEIEALEEKLKTPERTEEDITRHAQLINEFKQLMRI